MKNLKDHFKKYQKYYLIGVSVLGTIGTGLLISNVFDIRLKKKFNITSSKIVKSDKLSKTYKTILREPKEDVVIKPKTVNKPIKLSKVPEKYRNEVSAIQKHFGPLTPGMEIKTTLTNIQNIIPKSRKRVDAYTGLASMLKNLFGIVLEITSRKKKSKKKIL